MGSCPKCRHENPPYARFCLECGTRLATTCRQCGAEEPAGAKYCAGCGAPLLPAAGDTAAPSPALAVPALFAGGRYQVQAFLGEGAKKRVYLARDSRLDRDVALALIKTEGLEEAGLARIRREAQAMARLGDHPHIVTVYDLGNERGQPYIVSQYVAGGDLRRRLQDAEQHRLPVEEAVRLSQQICEALEHAHARGIIHRDLKPGNVWLTREGSAKLGDFGLAVSLERTRLTQEGMMVGTVAYMPPEQVLGQTPDARSDLYALGAVLYEMLTGRPPFLGDDAVAIISQHINTPPVAPSWHNPDVPQPLEKLILQLLAKVPEERPKSATAVREALTAIAFMPVAAQQEASRETARPVDALTGGVFVGRHEEMGRLKTALEDAISGRPRLLMLVGEPGVGKTRTVEELATYARLRAVQVLAGRCYEGEGAPAFWPWVQIVRSYVHDRDPNTLMSEMGSGAVDIGQVVSAVRERLPGLPSAPVLDPEQARFRLFDSLTTFLKNASKRQPLLLILDDLHWADKPSLLLLHYLARGMGGVRLLVLGTYRDVEVHPGHPLAEILAALRREPLHERIRLRGLPEEDVRALLAAISGHPVPHAFVHAIFRESEGNPFFIQEILRHLVEEGIIYRKAGRWTSDLSPDQMGIPEGVREVIHSRLSRLSEPCTRILSIASVIGREFEMNALERVSELQGDRLLGAVEEAVKARVVTEVPQAVGRYAFSHALIRETLYEELSAIRRVALHRRIGEVLEDLYGANPMPHLAELAYHFLEASRGDGEVDKAVDYAARAAERATASLAYEDAVTHYRRGLDALTRKEPTGGLRRCELLLALGEALMSTGDTADARETFRQAAELARELGAAEQLARAALGFGGLGIVTQVGVIDQALIELLEETLGLLREEDTPLRARLLGRLAMALYWSDARERTPLLSEQAVAMARRVRDPTTLAYTLHSRHWGLWKPENVGGRLAVADEIMKLADEVQDRGMLLLGRAWRIVDLLEMGELSLVDAEIDAYTRLAHELRVPQYMWWSTMFRAMRALLEGRFADGERLAREALAIGETTQAADAAQTFGVHMIIVRREQGGLEELLGPTEVLSLQYPSVRGWRAALANLHTQLRHESEAREEFELLAGQDFADFPMDLIWLSSMSQLAETCAFLGDTRRATTLYSLLLPYREYCILTGYGIACIGSVSRILGLLAATMSRWEEAARHFEHALEMNARIGARPWLAHTEHDYGCMLLARGEGGDRHRALELLNRALATARELGMTVLMERALATKLEAQGITSVGPATSIDAVASGVGAERPDLRPHAAPDGTVTILFTDIEGSTPLAERLGDQCWLSLIRDHNAIVREQVAAHGGVEVKSQGDGFMIAFQSARRGLHCAIAIQRAVAAYDDRHPDVRVYVRMGLHTGEAIRESADFFGKSVILAARIAGHAHGGEILTSSLVKELTESSGDIEFGEAQRVELKGLSGAYTLHTVAWTA